MAASEQLKIFEDVYTNLQWFFKDLSWFFILMNELKIYEHLFMIFIKIFEDLPSEKIKHHWKSL